MIVFEKIVRPAGFLIVAGLLLPAPEAAKAASPIRSQAVVDLSFDEPTGDSLDHSVEGRFKNRGGLANGAVRVPSPFWAQDGKSAILLDAPQKQYVQIADSGDVDRPDAVTLSFYFLSLHDLDDAAAHGILAKRIDESMSANYGINFVPKNDVVQVYLNHGSGYRFPSYSLQQSLGSRRRVYLTATFEKGDAPEPDADTDADDIRIRLFANGKQIKPTAATASTLVETDAWITDVDATKLLNDAPLVLGATTTGLEFTSGLIDEFLLFPRALTPEEIAQLFVEVAGPTGPEMAQRELQEPPARTLPRITGVSLRGRAGDRTRLEISGENLSPAPRLALPIANVKQVAASESNAAKLVVDVTLPVDTPPGYYPLSVATNQGISNSLTIAIDRLEQIPATRSTPAAPSALPSAFTGVISGGESGRVYFLGKAGQRVVADVDARRLGASFDPVVEIKNSKGTPLVIEWGKPQLNGDARAELVLPEDGAYSVDLHDLAYKAPAASPFRLKLGNIALIDAWFPAAVARGSEVSIQPVGSGIPAGTTVTAAPPSEFAKSAELVSLPRQLEPYGPPPVVRQSHAIEVIEMAAADGQLQSVDAQFTGPKHIPIAINGRISKPGEQDRFLLQVTPGQKLDFAVAGRSINSPLDARLTLLKHPEGTPLVQSDDSPGSRDPQVTFDVPQGVNQIVASVADLYGRGNDTCIYRLTIGLAGQPDFSLTAQAAQVVLPESGTAILRVDVNRSGYTGPIQLSIDGDPSVAVFPAEIEAGDGMRKTFVTLKRSGGGVSNNPRRLMLIGESVGIDPPIRRATIVANTVSPSAPPAFREEIVVFIDTPVSFEATVASSPGVLFKGLPAEVPVGVSRAGATADKTVTLNLVSTEAARPVDPKDAAKGNLPLISGSGNLPASAQAGNVKVSVPLDVAEGDITFVVRADARSHAWSRHSFGTAFSQPFHIAVRDAVALELVPETLALTGGASTVVRGTVKRAQGFAGPVVVAIAGLPEGYSTPAITVPADKEQFEIPVTAGAEAQARDLPNVILNVSAAGVGPILPGRPIPLKVAPKQ